MKLPADVRQILEYFADNPPMAVDNDAVPIGCQVCDAPLRSRGAVRHGEGCIVPEVARILEADDALRVWQAIPIAAAAMQKARDENPRGDAYLSDDYPIDRLMQMFDQNVSEIRLALQHDNDVEDKLADGLNYLSFVLHKYRLRKAAPPPKVATVFFFDCEDVRKEYHNIELTPAIMAEIAAWIAQTEIEESYVQIF